MDANKLEVYQKKEAIAELYFCMLNNDSFAFYKMLERRKKEISFLSNMRTESKVREKSAHSKISKFK